MVALSFARETVCYRENRFVSSALVARDVIEEASRCKKGPGDATARFFRRSCVVSPLNSIHLCANCFDMCPHCGLPVEGEERRRAAHARSGGHSASGLVTTCGSVQSNAEEEKKWKRDREDRLARRREREQRRAEMRRGRFNFLIRADLTVRPAPTEFNSPPSKTEPRLPLYFSARTVNAQRCTRFFGHVSLRHRM